MYNAQLLSLHNVMSLFAAKVLQTQCLFQNYVVYTPHCMDERCASVMPQSRSTEQPEVGCDNTEVGEQLG